jgi:hypothetical protein
MKKLPFIPVQFSGGQDAEFAGKQYQMTSGIYINDSVPVASNHEEFFFDSIIRLLYSNFKWYNIEEYEAHEIEYQLINNGRVCAVRSRFDLNTQTPDGIFYGMYASAKTDTTYDFYGRSNGASVTGRNGKVIYAYNNDDFVIGFDSNAYYLQSLSIRPLYYWVQTLAADLADAYGAWRVAVDTRKSGMVFIANNKQQANILRNVLKRKKDNQSFIVVEGGDFSQPINAMFPNYTANIVSEYHNNFMSTWGFVMDLLGLENTSSNNKKERLITSEIEMNKTLSRYIGADRLSARKHFAEEINKKFGTNIKVENYLASIAIEDGNEANIYGISRGENNEPDTENN